MDELRVWMQLTSDSRFGMFLLEHVQGMQTLLTVLNCSHHHNWSVVWPFFILTIPANSRAHSSFMNGFVGEG